MSPTNAAPTPNLKTPQKAQHPLCLFLFARNRALLSPARFQNPAPAYVFISRLQTPSPLSCFPIFHATNARLPSFPLFFSTPALWHSPYTRQRPFLYSRIPLRRWPCLVLSCAFAPAECTFTRLRFLSFAHRLPHSLCFSVSLCFVFTRLNSHIQYFVHPFIPSIHRVFLFRFISPHSPRLLNPIRRPARFIRHWQSSRFPPNQCETLSLSFLFASTFPASPFFRSHTR